MIVAAVFLVLLVGTGNAASTLGDLVGTWTTKSRSVVTGPVCMRKPGKVDGSKLNSRVAGTGVLQSYQRRVHRAEADWILVLVYC